MFGLRRKRPVREGVVGFALYPDGVALAHVVDPGAERPRLASCVETRSNAKASSVAAILAEQVQALGLSGCAGFGVLPPEAYGLWLLDAPDVEASELGGAIRWLVRDLVDYSLDEAVTDYFDVPDDVSRGRQRRIYVVAAHSQRVQHVLDAATASGLALGPIDISELAARNLAERLARPGRGFALLQIGPRRGLLTITRGHDLLLARGLDFGLDVLGEEPPSPTSDELALESEGGEQREALLLEIQRSLDYVESQLGQPPVDELVLAPLEEPAPGLLEFLEKNLVARVRRFDLGDLFEGGDEVPDRVQARCLAAVGAALRTESRDA